MGEITLFVSYAVRQSVSRLTLNWTDCQALLSVHGLQSTTHISLMFVDATVIA